MVVQRCIIAHLNRLVATNRMVLNLSFYDLLIPSYLEKRQKSAFYYDTAPIYILKNNSETSDRTEFYNSSFEPSRCDESNGAKFVFL